MPFHFLASSSWLPIFMTMQFCSMSLVSVGLSGRIAWQVLRPPLSFAIDLPAAFFTILPKSLPSWEPSPLYLPGIWCYSSAVSAAKAFPDASQLFANDVREYLHSFYFALESVCLHLHVERLMFWGCQKIAIPPCRSGSVRNRAAVQLCLLLPSFPSAWQRHTRSHTPS